MKRLLPLLLLWLNACATLPRYTAMPPTTQYATIDTYGFRSLAGQPAVRVAAGQPYTIVGLTNDDWFIVSGNGRRFLVPRAAFAPGGVAPTPATAYPSYSAPVHDTYTGPRGGQYYYNGQGSKQYVTPQSTIDRQNVQTGPRGGQYYINRNGNKTYIKH